MGKFNMVPAAFLETEKERLGISWDDLADKLGVSHSWLYSMRTAGECPVFIRVAVNGLLAEKVAGGTGQIKNLPAVIPPKVQRRATAVTDGFVVFAVRCPSAPIAVAARAAVAAIGCDVVS